MKIETKEKLPFFQELYREARAASDELYVNMSRHFAQYRGSDEIDGSQEKAKQVRNITYELVESQVASYIPKPSVRPKMWSERKERNAKSIETLLGNKRDELPFEKHNDMDERFNLIYGGSVWLVEWDESIITHNTVGDVKVTCLSPSRFTGQPNIYDIDDMEYCFIEFETTKEDIVRKYGVSPEVADETESDENADDKTATLYVCYYKDADDKVCQFVWSGDTQLLDIEDYYARKRKVCKTCGKREEICECDGAEYEEQNEEYEELLQDVHLTDGTVIPAVSEVIEDGQVVMTQEARQGLTEDGRVAMEQIGDVLIPIAVDIPVPMMEPTRLPFYRPSILPVVIRKNTSQEESLFGQSDCEFIRPQQQAINKIESRIMEKLLGSGVFPVVPEDCTVDMDNTIFKRVYKANPSNYNLFGRVDLQVDISRDVAEAERLYDQAKRILGITDSYQGQYDSSAQSGKAKQLQIQQAAGRLDSKRQMKNAAYSEIDRIIFQYYLAYADEPRPATFKDAFGRIQNSMFNRYDFIERDETGRYYYNDEYLFSTDASIDVERTRELLWQENRTNFQLGAYGDPSLPQTRLIYWLNMEKTHYPFAHDNVERIREEIDRAEELAQYEEATSALQQEVRDRAEYEDYLKEQIQNNGGNIGEQGL